MNRQFYVTMILIFLCVFFGLLGAVGITATNTEYALFSFEILIGLIERIDSDHNKP